MFYVPPEIYQKTFRQVLYHNTTLNT